jgi:hypothetical protein
MARERGRPRKTDSPRLPWDEVDRLLVLGEKVTDEASGREEIRYPSFRDVATRYGVSKSLVGKYAAKHNCMKRREENRAREQMQFEQEVVKIRAKARALSTDDEIRIIDDYLRGFEKALAENKVRYDNPADFNTMVRLKEFKLGHADSRQEVKGFVSLEEIQARHRLLRDQLAGIDPALSGIAGPDEDPASSSPSEPAAAGDAPAQGEDPGEAVH